MSKEALSGLAVAEKIFGIIIIIIGTIITHNTYNNMSAAGLGANFFIAIGIALIILGLILTTARTK